MTIRCRQEDKAIVENAVGPALNSVKDLIKRDVDIKVDQENFLSPKWYVVSLCYPPTVPTLYLSLQRRRH